MDVHRLVRCSTRNGLLVPFPFSRRLRFHHLVLSCARTHRTYDVVVQLSLTSVFGLFYLCLFAFIHRYGFRHSFFLEYELLSSS
ncbi:hypothetical protein BHE74_00028106 [Ensete ventricosum]|nr:hypothetical protein BHE74_00028106 [Ensete ventricosum]